MGVELLPIMQCASMLECGLLTAVLLLPCVFGCRESELQSAAFGANEASCHLNELRAQVDQLAAATRSAEETASAATGAQVKTRRLQVISSMYVCLVGFCMYVWHVCGGRPLNSCLVWCCVVVALVSDALLSFRCCHLHCLLMYACLNCCSVPTMCAGALEAAQQDAAKERAARQRHEDVSGATKLVWQALQHYAGCLSPSNLRSMLQLRLFICALSCKQLHEVSSTLQAVCSTCCIGPLLIDFFNFCIGCAGCGAPDCRQPGVYGQAACC